jgi:hypothetical protein
METFKIEIQEFLSKIVEVQASSEDEALNIVKSMYNEEEIILTYEDIVSTEISPYSED